ncbi:MAG: PAS domain S-box protein [Coleofasciculus sp. S288]|nr:PAS domain S-box protein [Coleofasciculus sp. S288]
MKEKLGEVEQQFQTLFKFAPMGMALIDREGVLIQSNPTFQALLGSTEKEVQSLSFTELTYPDDQSENVRLFQEMVAGSLTHFCRENRYVRKDGGLIWGHVTVNTVCDADGVSQYAIATLHPISENEQPQLDLQDAYVQLTQQVTEQSLELVHLKTLLQQEIIERKKAQEALNVRQEFLQTLVNLYPETVFAKGSFAVVTDATTLEAMESELQQTKEQLRAVLDAVPGFVCWVNSNGQYLGVNQYMADTFNLPPDVLVGQELNCLGNSPEFAQFMTQFLVDSAQTGHREIKAQVNGLIRDYLIVAQKYHQDSLAVAVGIDITQRKQAEVQIQASLQEKEVLLQEIHHRVKNNLQVISSLLDLQSQQIEEPAMLEVFRESQNRVKSMALIHEKLYQSQNFTKINFDEYVKSLTNYLFKAYELNADNIALEVCMDEVKLNIDTAIPCGLIINELVSNALKHAFPNNRTGTVRLAMNSDSDNHFTLLIEDDGVGFPATWELKTARSLGIQIVHVLVKQIKGKIDLDRNKGSKFRVSFSEVNPYNHNPKTSESKTINC